MLRRDLEVGTESIQVSRSSQILLRDLTAKLWALFVTKEVRTRVSRVIYSWVALAHKSHSRVQSVMKN